MIICAVTNGKKGAFRELKDINLPGHLYSHIKVGFPSVRLECYIYSDIINGLDFQMTDGCMLTSLLAKPPIRSSNT